MIDVLTMNMSRQALNCKPFDPISIDNIDTFGDWIVEENNLISGLSEGDHWMLLNQPVSDMVPSGYINDEEEEIFIAGMPSSLQMIYWCSSSSFV